MANIKMVNIKREARKEFFERLEKLKEDNSGIHSNDVDEVYKSLNKMSKMALKGLVRRFLGDEVNEINDTKEDYIDEVMTKKFGDRWPSKITESLQDRISNLKEDNTMSNSSAVTTKKMLKEQSFKVGDMVVVGKGTPNEKKGKVEKTNPLKIRTDPTSTMVVHPSMSVELAESFSESSFKKGDKLETRNGLATVISDKGSKVLVKMDKSSERPGEQLELPKSDVRLSESFSESGLSDKAIEKADKMLLDAANKISSASTGDRNVDKIVQEVDSFIMNKKKELEQMHSINK